MPAKPLMIYDQNATAIQSLAPTSPTNITIEATSNRAEFKDGTSVVRLATLVDCWVKFGDNSVSATTGDILVPAGVEVFKIPLDATHIAVIQNSTGGTLNVSAMA